MSAFLLALGLAAASGAPTTVTVLAISDYHSHAMPFYSEGRAEQAGIARAIAYLKARKAEKDTIVVSGGDTVNKGSPLWSDEYRCVEWPWLNGLVDMMALGNHDLDYGWNELERCRAAASYPLLSANLLGADGAPLFAPAGKPYLVREIAGVRLGFFALGGPDVQHLIRKEDMPAGSRWRDSLETAHEIVTALRDKEKVQAVVFIGHQQREEDEAMVRAVPGIDLVLGTHAHHKGEWTQIAGTNASYIAPYQYLTYVSEVQLRFAGGKLAGMTGRLVKLDETMPEDRDVKQRVTRLQHELQAKRPERFAVLGQAAIELSDANVASGESLIGNWATEVLRRATQAQVFITTSSGFRAGIPPGPITVEAFYAAIPYKNRLVTADLTGRQLEELLALNLKASGSGGFSQQSGLRYRAKDGRPVDISVLKDGADPAKGFAPLDPSASYHIATTDFQAYVAGSYRELFATAARLTKTELDAHELLIEALRAGPISATLDGRGP